jgi:hypothetical protein
MTYVSPFRCPRCGADELARERRPNGNSKCVNRHEYPSRDAIRKLPTTPEPTPTCKVIGSTTVRDSTRRP